MLDVSALAPFFEKLMSEKEEYINEKSEQILKNLYTYILDNGSTAIDVGSQWGTHTLPMAKIAGQNGHVFSFEPLKEVVESQLYSIKKNSFNNISLHNIAVSNFIGNSQFIYISDSIGVSGLKRMPHQMVYGSKEEIIEVAVDTLDNVIPGNTKVDFIKVDTEGGDFFVLKGAKRILTNDRPVFVFECGSYLKDAAESYDYTKEEYENYFEEIKYNLFNITGIPFSPVFWNTKVPPYMVGIPHEKVESISQLFWICILEALLYEKKA